MERKLVTVLFADLVGSTALADEEDPERTRAVLDRFYEEMAAEVETVDGTVEKFAGDAVMAAFGAPTAHEDHAERALHAALAMQRRLHEAVDPRLSLRIGVNTGDVVVDRPREGSSFVTGDAVNVAARLEQAAEPDEILVGERAVAAARGAFEFGELRTIAAKGKEQPVECRPLLRPLSLMRPRGVAGLEPAFVGRDGELAALEAEFDEAGTTGQVRLVTVLGDAGVGKTRVVREFWERLAERSPQPPRRVGRCLPYGDGITFWPLAEILKEHFGILDSDSPDVALERLGEREILGLALGLDVTRELHPLAARDRFQDAWVELFEELARDRPAAVLIEDAHWSEEPFLELVERVVRDAQAPVLLLVTARPELIERHPGWGARVPGKTIQLDALSEEETARMVDELLAESLPRAARDDLVAQAEGNPFFVEELLATLIDRGLLRRSNGGWALDNLPADFDVPDSVQAVVAARIDLLDPAEKEALQAAAVIGRVFWTGPVYELVEAGAPDFDVLEARDFIRRRPGSSMAGQREYAIKHALTREVAYASLTKRQRGRKHAAFASWLEQSGAGRDEDAALLAHHLAEAVRPDDADLVWPGDEDELERLRPRAVRWLRRAAELAIARYELDDGRALLRRAVVLESRPAERAAIWREIGRANVLKFDGEAFWAAMEDALASTDDEATLADTYAELAFQTVVRRGMWKKSPDPEQLESWIDRAVKLGEPRSAARAKGLIARCLWSAAGTESAAREATAIAEEIGDVELVSRAWGARGSTFFAEGNVRESLAWMQRRLDLVAEISDPDHVADIYEDAIPSFVATGQLSDARRLAGEHRAVVDPLSAHHRVHGVAVLLETEEAAGGWDAALALAPRTEAAVDANLETPCVRNARSLLVTALAAGYNGDWELSDRLESRAGKVAMAANGFVLAAPRARLAILRGRLEELEALLPELEQTWMWCGLQNAAARLDAMATLGDRKQLEAEGERHGSTSTYLEPFALRALGIVREDETLLTEAVAQFEAIQLDWHAAETRRLLAV
jgi:class 3 adenylate cyclase